MGTLNLARVCALWGLVLAGAASWASAAPFQNGDFEIPSEPGAMFIPLTYVFENIPVLTLPGWVAETSPTGNDNDQNFLITSAFDHTPSGNQAVLLNSDGNDTTTLAQTFDTQPGQAYAVSFVLTAQTLGINQDGTTYIPAHVLVQASGNGNSQQSYLATGTPVANVFPNLNYTYSFLEQSPQTTLTFTQSDGGPASPILDNVQVQTVPEPGTIGLCLTAAMALLARREKTH